MILLLALTMTPPPAEPRWETVGSEGGIETAFDPASVQRAGDRLRLRISGVAAAPGADGIARVAGQIEIDCRARTRTGIEVRGYGADGGLLLAALVPAAERVAEPIRPGSRTDAIARRICGNVSERQ